MTHRALPQTRAALFAVAATALLLGACGETSIQLSTDKTEISAGGIEFAVISARVFVESDPAANAKVTFETSSGSFADGSLLQTKDAATDSSGVAEVKLYSDLAPGQATVTAQYYDEASGITATSTISIKFTAASGENLPVDGKFRLTCDAVNVGGLREPVPDIKVTCDITAQNRKDVPIPAAALSPEFRSEAGSIKGEDDPSTGKRVFIYTPRGGNSAPKDVPPEQSLGEPMYLDGNGLERNPRDGLVTLMAFVDGEEAFTDTNGNGKYDSGEPFVDAAEPFVDVNDNDKWDSTESFIDTNGNGIWDPGNGQWDAKTKIMALYKILWSGKVDNSKDTSRIDALNPDIFDGGKITLKAWALDINKNPVAAFQANSDYLEWTLSSAGDATSNDNTAPPMSNEYGFSFDKAANTERKRWKILPNTFKPTTYEFTVEDGYPQDGAPATSYSVSVRVYVTPGQSGGGYYLNQKNEPFKERVEGKCD